MTSGWTPNRNFYSKPNFKSGTMHLPFTPMSFTNGKCQIYDHRFNLKKSALQMGGYALVEAFFLKKIYANILAGPFYFKLVLSWIPVWVLSPFMYISYTKLKLLVLSMYLLEDGETIELKTLWFWRSKSKIQFKISDIRKVDEDIFQGWFSHLSGSSDRFFPLNWGDQIFLIDRQGVFFHEDVFKSIIAKKKINVSH